MSVTPFLLCLNSTGAFDSDLNCGVSLFFCSVQGSRRMVMGGSSTLGVPGARGTRGSLIEEDEDDAPAPQLFARRKSMVGPGMALGLPAGRMSLAPKEQLTEED